MNWFLKRILAQQGGLAGYLSTLGVSPDVSEYIQSLDQPTAQFLTNEVRKNPSLNLNQLQTIEIPKKKMSNPYLAEEMRLASRFNCPKFQKWVLVNCRKLRKGAYYLDHSKTPIFPFNHPNLTEEDYTVYRNFKDEVPLIWDWCRATNSEISSFSPQNAALESQEWHRMMAGEGSGKMYEPIQQENVVYGPKWNNPEWEGWTVQLVTTENDLLAEGNKMNHCVGGYCDDVFKKKSVIYSLRDPQNEPHITVEVEGEKSYSPGKIVQIQGNSNSDPEEAYRPMIKEWMSNKGEALGINTTVNAFESLDEDNRYSSPSVEEINETLNKILQVDANDMGLKYVLDEDYNNIINRLLTQAESENWRHDGFRGDITNSSYYLVELALLEDLQLPHYPKNAGEFDSLIRKNPLTKTSNWSSIRQLMQEAYKLVDDVQEDFIHYDTGLQYPQEEDYESTEEYEEALREYDDNESEIQSEWLKESLKGGFGLSILEDIRKWIQEKVIPDEMTLYELSKKEKLEKELSKQKEQQTNVASRVNWYKKAQQTSHLRKKQLEQAAIKEFGLTNNIGLAGYILSDGRMLNFSVDGLQRDHDHRAISGIDTGKGKKSLGMYEFMRETGAIRVSASNRDISMHIMMPPTSAQIETIAKASKYATEVYIDVQEPFSGNIITSREFTHVFPSQVISYLQNLPQVFGGSKESKFKYPSQIYQAYNTFYGTHSTPDEIDSQDFNHVRQTASMGMTGGRDEFDELMNKHQSKTKNQSSEKII